MTKKLFFPILIIIIASCGSKDDWKPLFNGQNFDDFKQLGGEALFKVENGEMVGIAVAGTPNSFMATENVFGDFILEFEMKADVDFNSGVQIRSHYNERVYGYQYEIDPTDRGWSGGIYDESRKGWLYPVTVYNPDAKNAFKYDEWNKCRVEAIGSRITTWLNDIPISDLLDNEDNEGFIAFQVHSVSDENVGKEVRFRNIRIVTKNLEKYSKQSEVAIYQVNRIPNTISDFEKSEGWRLLFDGETHNGWRGAHSEQFPEKGWTIKDGVLSVEPSTGGESQNGGDIVTEEEFSDFILTLEFLITPGANSGIKYFVTEKYNTSGSAIGLEYQILDDNLHPDAKMGKNGNRTLSSLYDLIPAKNKRFNGVGEWNYSRIVSKGQNVEHWLNGFKVLEYERGSSNYIELVKESKYSIFENFGEAEKGRILLQDHGDEVSFRSIKIKVLQ